MRLRLVRVWINQSVGVLAACINLLEPRPLPLSIPIFNKHEDCREAVGGRDNK